MHKGFNKEVATVSVGNLLRGETLVLHPESQPPTEHWEYASCEKCSINQSTL